MSTGQYPKRRETDEEARVRNTRAANMEEERLMRAWRIPAHVAKALLPRITTSGRLVDGGR